MGHTTARSRTNNGGRAATEAADAAALAAMKETAATLVTVASAKLHNSPNMSTRTTRNENSNITTNRDRVSVSFSTSCAETASKQATRAASTNPRTNQSQSYSVVMTTIGLGIDPFFGANTTSAAPNTRAHATIAAVKAVRDAMERGVLRFPADHSNLYLHIQLGVPPTTPGGTEPMPVELGHLTPLLPSFIPLLPVQVVVGGLLVRHSQQQNNACTAVACITLQRATSVSSAQQHPSLEGVTLPATPGTTPAPSGLSSPTSVALSSPTSVAAGQHADAEAPHALSPPTSWAQVVAAAPAPPRQQQLDTIQQSRTSQSPAAVHRSASIDMLARVSAELHKEQPLLFTKSLSCPAIHKNLSRSASQEEAEEVEVGNNNMNSYNDDERGAGAGPSEAGAIADSVLSSGNNYNYKKLPPGTTPKNNKRLFVQHSYQDFSLEQPLPEELDLVVQQQQQNAAGIVSRTPGAAFPLKLHETLALIEAEGFQHIIGWLPHGRSFKIHNQKEFVESILPKYFIMTKKSSFLRQLNLYGFNRLSGAGLDQGSYYHEKFLRGIKFLCRRIHRQKVNGNGIRAAGNPDGEPNLSRFPICPPPSEIATRPMSSAIIVHPGVAAAATSAPVAAATTTAITSAAGAVTTACGGVRIQPTQQQHEEAALVMAMSAPLKQPLQQLQQQQPRQQQRQSRSKATRKKASGSTTTKGSAKRSRTTSAASSSAVPFLDLSSPQEDAQLQHQQHSAVMIANTGMIRGNSSGPHPSFPLKLQRILDKLESQGSRDIISWLSHGRAFLVHDADRFVKELMPRYFNQTKYSSFQRQLHMYHFQRITAGRDKGAYHHPHFQRNHPERCFNMHRTRINGKGTRRPGNPDGEPNLYLLTPIPPIQPGTHIEIPNEVPPLHAEDDHCSQASADSV